MRRGWYLTFLMLLTVQLALALTLEELQRAIVEKGARWTAGSNNVWELPQEAQLRLMGTVPQDSEFIFATPTEVKAQFTEVDWRNRYGINYVTPVTDQGYCGSCVAFASVAAMETQFNIANNWPGLNWKFSEQFLWSCSRRNCESGWWVESGANALKNMGTTDEACYPYMSGAAGENLACSQACPNNQQRIYRIKDYRSIGYSYERIWEALNQGPLLTRMTVYEDFIAYKGGIYEHVAGDALGGHAVTIVGYNIPEKYWIVKNSWSHGWGEEGFFRIKMDDDSGVGVSSYQMIVEPFLGAATIVKPGFREMIKGNYQVVLASSFQETRAMRLELRSGESVLAFEASPVAGSREYNINLDTSTIPDGVYEAQAVAVVSEALKEEKSYIQRFFVLNGVPQLVLTSHTLQDGITIKGSYPIEFMIETSPVPLQRLVVNVKNSEGEIKKIETENPAKRTVLRWNTKRGPNGVFELWGEAHIGDYSVITDHVMITVKN